jgi:hypothetical protein
MSVNGSPYAAKNLATLIEEGCTVDIAMKEDAHKSVVASYRLVLSALHSLPDRCASSVGELADRIGTDKLDLISWGRADLEFARLIAAKMVS